jgi:uncharacterized protein
VRRDCGRFQEAVMPEHVMPKHVMPKYLTGMRLSAKTSLPLFRAAALALAMILSAQLAPAAAQSQLPPASPVLSEQMVAARELVTVMKMTDLLKTMVPALMNQMKATMLVGRPPEFVRDFEAAMPVIIATMERHYGEFTDAMATVYAANFSAQELRDITAFYRTSTGQKMLARMPLLTQESIKVGQAWGLKMAEDLKQRMITEMRKKGYNI